jgi:hypothetical protein
MYEHCEKTQAYSGGWGGYAKAILRVYIALIRWISHKFATIQDLSLWITWWTVWIDMRVFTFDPLE